ncbi:hypothetical protein pdam_00004230 [Pocillopora damicornis]|uniref:DZIP3-like HEPN domain-containing protein n=1 Tax=Pocillopora damicornis TaxID=46731 RepID=A0A3M6UG88_POCDA|nr:hypothetical protein pdam_00004230 [Pocillopora damicornis]
MIQEDFFMASVATPSYHSTKETTNYARLCRLLVDAGSDALRDAFDKSRPTGDLNSVLSSPPVHAASVDDPTFNQYWQDIQGALVRLGGASYQSAIDDLKKECIDPDFEEHYRELLKHCNGIHKRTESISKKPN